jgi:membrane protein required for colicin V production
LELDLPWFDIIVLTILVVSALMGFFRGAAREMLTVGAFLAAAFGAVYGLRYTGPVARNMIDPDWAGTVGAGVVTFLVIYIVLRLLGAGLAQRIHSAQGLGLLDRSIGLGFGLIRALILLGAFNIAFNAATPPERTPKWMVGAALYPMTSAAARVLKSFAPRGLDMADRLKPALDQAVHDGSVNAPRDSSGARGYDARERGHIDDLVEKSR